MSRDRGFAPAGASDFLLAQKVTKDAPKGKPGEAGFPSGLPFRRTKGAAAPLETLGDA